MAREVNRLTDRKVASLKEPGLHADGAGLYLRIDQAGGRRWVYVFHLSGRRREMGLGSGTDVRLKDARHGCEEARRAVRDGRDPIAERRITNTPAETVATALDALLEDLRGGWKNAKHSKQWRTMLDNHAAAVLAAPVADVSTEDVLRALRPIWTAKPVTARRVRERLERVLDAAKARGLRTGENPARWKGHLDALLARARPAPRHHAALPYTDAPAFMRDLTDRDSTSARALRWTVLTAARTGETIGATWAEVQDGVWVVPAARMKMRRNHRVPLSQAALRCLGERGEPEAPVFAGGARSGGLSNMAMAELLKGVRPGVTVHGFRSTFRDWAGDRTLYPRELAEAALAHAVGDEVEKAYRRSDALEKRRALMDAWAEYLARPEGENVIQLRR